MFSGFRISGFRFGLASFRFLVQVLWVGCWGLSLELRGFGSRAQELGFGVQDLPMKSDPSCRVPR